jgi:hypothetical protein
MHDCSALLLLRPFQSFIGIINNNNNEITKLHARPTYITSFPPQCLHRLPPSISPPSRKLARIHTMTRCLDNRALRRQLESVHMRPHASRFLVAVRRFPIPTFIIWSGVSALLCTQPTLLVGFVLPAAA